MNKKLEEEHDQLVRCHQMQVQMGWSLPKLMLRGWFNDQIACWDVFIESLSPDVVDNAFSSPSFPEALKMEYKNCWPQFRQLAIGTGGVHKRPGQLNSKDFGEWLTCVYNGVQDVGSLEKLLEHLGSVEKAHERFRAWFVPRTKKVRILNAADAARLLAVHGYLQPENRPLLTRGALRGAAILLDDVSQNTSTNDIEELYADEISRTAVEEKAASYIRQCLPDMTMADGESWFCNEIHKRRYPEFRSQR